MKKESYYSIFESISRIGTLKSIPLISRIAYSYPFVDKSFKNRARLIF